ncbi:iron-sulfur cluster assembly scaffold protein [Alteraurantiacibacter aquimixticola]|uniref:Iron-sulfur cluster assembly scaffold protein n=1 Tax=Alteraurantiacibacter aquimixticola TaxID=2489173 RepID=A0A4T3EZ94_9SPHN|nr:iron-sulfur cluster assembly scaffold protein [Alteraurantiacibacter aquimixticola]TIX50072.1 iron-sulfur cluster assembly scaffold protein [Alteraurantiacibacter aquimixticola]
MSAEKLYTPELLALTVELAGWPAMENLPFHGEARSTTCGSTLALDVSLDDTGRIETLGMRVRACAVGQASAAIFARHAKGMNLEEMLAAHDRIEGWLDGEAPIAEWPDLVLIAPARDYPARHGAIILPWKAAISALSSAPAAS